MPLSRSRDYLSIGEVLENVRQEFPDISISKIRFLEAEGLITPQRTGSGYRKFYEGDVSRLRYILQLQRDHFLPLKVIRERLAEADSNGGVYPQTPAAAAPAPAPAPVAAAAPEPAADLAGVSLTRDELAKSAGLSAAQLAELEEYGILPTRDGDTFNEHDLVVAKAAGRFFEYGVQARHLKMYRQFAEREAAFFEQIITPAARRKDPGAQSEAARSLRELAGLSRQLKEAALRESLRDLI